MASSAVAAKGALVPLPVLARRINEAHENCLKGLRHGLQYAIAAGEALLEVKGQLQHGEFMPWVEANCIFGQWAACKYMRIARQANLCDYTNLPPEELFRLLAGQGTVTNSDSPAHILPWPECIDKLQDSVFRLRDRWPPKALARLPDELRKLAVIVEHGLQHGQ